MDRVTLMMAEPSVAPERVLGALHPRMLALAAERTAGAHPYLVPPAHTARARTALGPGRLLAPEQAAVLETDAAKARTIARTHMAPYLMLPNYVRNLKTLGFGDADLADGGSDALVDAIVVWGDAPAIAARVRAHHEAGADHVCVQVLTADPFTLPRAEWRALAPVLLAGR
jgi:probable F420-dependent oxidoreductase